MEPTAIRPAAPDDLPALQELLRAAALPATDVGQGPQAFLLAWEGGRLVGSVGLELHGRDGLLRSLAVVPGMRGRGLGTELLRRALELAAARGVVEVYLLTTTAERWFAALEFARIEREQVPAALQATPEFAALCPSTAACMVRRLLGFPPA